MKLSLTKIKIILCLLFVIPIFFLCCKPRNSKTIEYKKLPQQEIKNVIKNIPSSVGLGFSGIGFFNDSLFISSNLGIIEVDSSNKISLHKWYEWDDVISGPWQGTNNKSIWFYHAGLFKLIYFDGRSWNLYDMPNGNFSRGDTLNGFSVITNQNNTWLQGGETVWQLNVDNKNFVLESLPKSGYIKGALPIENNLGLIVRKKFISDLLFRPLEEKPTEESSDFLYILDNDSWIPVENDKNKYFYIKDKVFSKSKSFFISENGDVFEVTGESIEEIETSEFAEAITITSSDTILVSFHNKGVFEWVNEKWEKRFDAPYSKSESYNEQVFLAESDGVIALAVTQSFEKRKGRWFSSAWISKNGEFQEIYF